MAERHRVRCVQTRDAPEPEARIAKIGGTNAVGVNWRLTQDEAIAAIEGGRWDFFVTPRHGRAIEVVVGTTASGRKYLKTSADERDPELLLALPECG